MKICEPRAAVESQAPSSKPSEKPPRRSGRPTEVSLLSKLARNAPSSTAPTAQNGWRAMPPRETGPQLVLLSAIRTSVVGVNARFHRHARQELFEQRLVLVEHDPDRDTLPHLGEIAGRIVGRQQCKLRAGGRRDPLDAAGELLVAERIDPDIDPLAGTHMRQLRLLVIGDHIDIRQRHDVDEITADVDIVARLHLPLADNAVEWRDDFG